MEDTKQLKEVFDKASDFISPVLQKGTLTRYEIQQSGAKSLVEILGARLPGESQQHEPQRSAVIGYAIDLLIGIHHAFVDPTSSDEERIVRHDLGQEHEAPLEDAKRRRMIHALLDLLAFEGIYPSISPGVGIPLEQRMVSLLPSGVVSKEAPTPSGMRSQSEDLLKQIIGGLHSILRDERPSIQPLIRSRILPDVICGAAELAFNSQYLFQNEIMTFKDILYEIIDETPTPSLLPILSSFLQTSSSEWFKAQISFFLSRIPLRRDGVFQTILFIASQFTPSLGHDAESQVTNGPPITVQAIMQIARLLSSVPQGMSAEEYFTNIGPKLLSFLDGEDLDLKKTSSYVIGNGILAKREYGAVGTIGYRIFVLPCFEALNAKVSSSSSLWLRKFSPDGSAIKDEPKGPLSDSTLVSGETIRLAVDRLSTLTLSHPNPGLLKRLIGPVLLPLWGMRCYAKEQENLAWTKKLSELLHAFSSISAPASRFKKLVDHVLWDGAATWTFGSSGEEGDISLIKRTDNHPEGFNLVQTIGVLGDRIDIFLELLASDPQREEVTGDIFLYVSRQWLLGAREEGSENQPQSIPDDSKLQSAVQKLISAKFAEKLLDLFKDTLSRHPLKVLQIIYQLLESEVHYQQSRKKGTKDEPTMASIAHIARKEEDQSRENDEEGSESLTAAFSLLSTILTSPDFQLSDTIRPILQELKSKLDILVPSLSQHLVQPATTASMLLDITLSDAVPSELKPATTGVSSHVADLQKHRVAISNLSSPLPPVQAEGLSHLASLIKESSPVLDIPSTLTLLLSLITTDDESAASDEFVYLNVIKTIGLLAPRHPRLVIKTLADRYADRSEEATVLQRLKIGEALSRTVEELGRALVGEAAKTLGKTMVAVAGRRETKPQAKKEREQRAQQPIHDIEEENFPQEDDSDAEDPAQAAFSQNILDAWAAGAANDETPDDLRVRSSAMSILASAIRSNLSGMGRSAASAAVELALSTLTLEPGPESAILRRAAVVLLLDLVKALDVAREDGVDVGFGFSFTVAPQESSAANGDATIANVPEILRVVNFVESKETDDIVRGHVRVLVENLDAWTQNHVLWGIRDRRQRDDEGLRFELGDQLAGLNIRPLSTTDRPSGPRIEEIE